MSGKTSRDVATALGIAQSTVSRAFTPGASISPALRERIHAAAAAIDYRPNFLARGLVAGESRLIGMVIAPQTNLLYPGLLYELSRRLAARDRQLLLLPADDEAAAAAAIDRLRAYRVDAVVATGIVGAKTAREIVADGLPLVTFNRLLGGVAGVSCDFAAGSALLGRRLLAAGHRSFGFVGGPRCSWVSAQSLRGWRAAIEGVPGVTLASARAPFAYDGAADAVEQLRRQGGTVPTAILCVNDTVAAGCLDHLRYRLDRSVPRDVALVTFLGLGSGTWAGYALSGLAQPTEQMIEAVVAMLLDPDGPSRTANHRSFPPELVEGMTAPLAQGG